MLFNIFAKLIAAVLAAVMLVAPVSPVAARDEVCVQFNGWFSGHFYVVHPFEEWKREWMPVYALHDDFTRGKTAREIRERLVDIRNKMRQPDKLLGSPRSEQEPERRARYEWMKALEARWSDTLEYLVDIEGTVANLPDDSPFDAKLVGAAIKSGSRSLGQTACVSLREVPRDARFYVLVNVYAKLGRRKNILCQAPPSASGSDWWTANRRGRKIVYHTAGNVFHPSCRFHEERN